MAPPTSVSSPRTHPSNAPGTPGYANYNETVSAQRHTPQAPSLYASILAPPATKQARTIHNPSDPPVPPPSRPEPSPRPRAPKASPKTESSRSHGKAKQSSKPVKAPVSPNRRRAQGGSIDKGKRKQNAEDMSVDGDGDVDMKAAAALTSLLRHHNRPSIGSASSPRSSIDGSEVSSAYSYSHFTQSSTRSSAPSVPNHLSAVPSSSNIAAEPSARTQTPPPYASTNPAQHASPRAAPTDSEAANLMLFLATSPSPARPANKDSKDMAAYRTLGGNTGLRSKGRVLFPSTSAMELTHEDNVAASGGTSHRPPGLTRGGESSFTSSISSIGGELGGGNKAGSSDIHSPKNRSTHTRTGSFGGDGIPQLLPPAPLPLPSGSTSPAGRKDPASRNNIFGVSGGNGPLEFNIHEFINASPSSPARSAHHAQGTGTHKSNLGLRADVGRKLFEEEQMRHAHAIQAATTTASIGVPSQRQEDRTLGAGIDLIHS